MDDFLFEWDPAKNISNLRKRGVSFEDASLVFNDPLHMSWCDSVQNGEERWNTYGMIEEISLLVVVHTFKEIFVGGRQFELIRIISARRAEPKEKRRYEKENG